MAQELRDQTVLVTGATGFIGSHLCRRLAAEKARVTAVGSSTDLRDPAQTRALIEKVKPQIIFHLASIVDPRRDAALLSPMMDINARATMNLLLNSKNVERFVHVGTCEEYGDGPAPFDEGQRERPVSPYSLSKVAGTNMALMMHQTQKLPVVVVRPFLTYGPGQDNDLLVPSLIRACFEKETYDLTPGEQTRDLVYVDDVVDGMLAAATAAGAVGEIINLGSGQEVKIRDLAVSVKTITGSAIQLKFGALPYRPGETMHFYAKVDKAHRLLGWSAKVPLETGLRNTISSCATKN